ncbi:MAG TPA: formate hydrogenlyase maturation protein HycH [Anaerolineales bacterium]
MAERVVFYLLTHKFVSEEPEAAQGPRQVIYYSLAIGHHVGVMDCFQPMLEMPLAAYRDWLEYMPEGSGRLKLEGLLKWGEIEITRGHVEALLPPLKAALAAMQPVEAAQTETLVDCLEKMRREPALTVMVRRRE